MSHNEDIGDAGPSSAIGPSAETLPFSRLSFNHQLRKNKKVTPDSRKVYSIGIFSAETLIESRIWGASSGLTIVPKTFDDGSTAIRLQASVPTPHDPNAKVFVEFIDDDKTAQVRYYRTNGVVPGALSVATSKTKEPEDKYLKIWIAYKKAELSGTPLECITGLGEFGVMLQTIVYQLRNAVKNIMFRESF
ncbi:hypothetical protein TWF694_006947 [Orbilia ellipsospora]|uniref:Uncharacterized protein n=1 Tax=Orbilia ellipsospora TaxID=2528407 RepID=A0AAV9XLP6_9PEZI